LSFFQGLLAALLPALPDMFSQLQKTLGATQSVREILRTDGEAVELKPITVESQYELKGNVRFEHVAFSYPSSKDILCYKIFHSQQRTVNKLHSWTQRCRQINHCFFIVTVL
jgi:ABC-type bacteriocin/lantibiotic exporter with double-glycine peptidase domain